MSWLSIIRSLIILRPSSDNERSFMSASSYLDFALHNSRFVDSFLWERVVSWLCKIPFLVSLRQRRAILYPQPLRALLLLRLQLCIRQLAVVLQKAVNYLPVVMVAIVAVRLIVVSFITVVIARGPITVWTAGGSFRASQHGLPTLRMHIWLIAPDLRVFDNFTWFYHSRWFRT